MSTIATVVTTDGWIPITPDYPIKPVTTAKPVTAITPITTANPVATAKPEATLQPATTPDPGATVAPGAEVMSNVTTSEPAPQEEEGLKVDQDYRTGCGKRYVPQKKIVGGEVSDFGEWPWQVSLRQWRQVTYLHKCGAALVNENWAITAAHCVESVKPETLLLRLGEYNLEDESEPYGYLERRVELIAIHPQFDSRTFEYDLAMLRFYEPVKFAPNIVPICLPEADDDYLNRTAWVTGWGRLYENGPLPSKLQEVPVPIIPNSDCESMYKEAGFVEHIPKIFLCGGYAIGGRDSCEGDSGGPLVTQRNNSDRHELIGIISWGIGCAQKNQPGVYTRITYFREWVEQIMLF